MRTFMARFVRPDGERGVIYVLSSSPSAAVLEVMEKQGPVSQISVTPRRRAALLVGRPWPALKTAGTGDVGSDHETFIDSDSDSENSDSDSEE